ncbi:tetratricopeptide repeat protein [Candidatus Epulonipiscium viviparus]|uniref:tetratricopeptide repeat protein n=1 Tax=Candidatus Epulonipiscium viviparus TaxID=420336 RepID=UPI00016BFF26|nr:tetratricopeptide repeat protein [Candidatus Epulopiscium viviparus]
MDNPSKDYEDLMYSNFANSEFQEALNNSLLYLQHNSTTLEILLLQSRCYNQLGEILNSLKKYQEIIELYPNCKDAYLELSVIFYKIGNYKIVIPLLVKAISLGHSENICLEIIADCYFHMSQFDQAANIFIKAIDFSEHKQLVYRNIAECYLHLGNDDLADKYLDLADA